MALEDGGVLLDGHSYSLCPGYPNPAELELIDARPHAIVYGVIGHQGRATIHLSVGTVGTFSTGTSLPSPTVRLVNGISFFIGSLPRSACTYASLELNVNTGTASAQHNLGFGICGTAELVPITESMGSWTGPIGPSSSRFGSPVPPTQSGSALPKRVVIDGSPGCSSAEAQTTALRNVSTKMEGVAGSPFDVAVLGNSSFVSLGNSIGVFSDDSFVPTLLHTINLPVQVAGEALTPDGRYLLAATDSGALVLSVAALENNSAKPILGSLSAPRGAGGIEVAVSSDQNYAFVSLEDTDGIAVFNLHAAILNGFASSGFVGTIPLGEAPVGMAISPNGRYLYGTSEGAGPSTDVGTLTVIDLHRAETNPSTSVIAVVTAGCEPVRVVTSGAGSVVWVTARASDQLLALSASKLIADPSKSLLAHVKVGEAPVGVIVLARQNRIIVANSNRFSATGASASLSVVDISDALAGRPSLLGDIASGGFPRQFAMEPNGKELLVTNYDSRQLEAVNLEQIPR